MIIYIFFVLNTDTNESEDDKTDFEDADESLSSERKKNAVQDLSAIETEQSRRKIRQLLAEKELDEALQVLAERQSRGLKVGAELYFEFLRHYDQNKMPDEFYELVREMRSNNIEYNGDVERIVARFYAKNSQFDALSEHLENARRKNGGRLTSSLYNAILFGLNKSSM